MLQVNAAQGEIARMPLDTRVFLSGPAGCGKTTTGVARLEGLLEAGVPGNTILILTPQRNLQEPYLDLLYSPEREAGGEVTPATIGGLARRMLDLFWPLAAETAGFAHPDREPVFLTLETAQYYMAHLVRPLLDEGYFESITIDRNRLYSQVIDNLNKSAVIGFPVDEIGARLDSAWLGDPAQRRVYKDAQHCATLFRNYCLEHNLLDFSLQLDVFWNVLWPEGSVRDYLTRTYRHLIYDNLEEDVPRGHDILRDWLPEFDSALLIYDQGGGYRRFLGSDPHVAWSLRDLCHRHAVLEESFVTSDGIAGLDVALSNAILPDESNLRTDTWNLVPETLHFIQSRFYPELLDAMVAEIESLINDSNIPPSEIVIVAPYLSDALRFSITNRLEASGVPWRSHRPSRSLRDEPASHALLTLAAVAHPGWGVRPPKFDLAYALMGSIAGLDLVRAQLLSEIVYRLQDFELSSFEAIRPEIQERITFSVGNRYTTLRDWLMTYRESEPLPLDHFLRKLFGEVLSQPGFGFHSNFDSVRVAASLVESVRKFRRAMEPALVDFVGLQDLQGLGREYLDMLNDGVIAAQYLESWRTVESDAVLIAPAYTFLMMNRPVTVQFWMDVGSSGWYERLAQPLTHPYVLSREWDASGGRTWSDADEVRVGRKSLARLTSGLLRRCRDHIYLCISDLGESGFEQRGDLLKSFQKVLQESME
jgi:hypothetical protein